MIVLVWLHGGNDLLVYGDIEHRVRLFHDRVGANFQRNVRNLPDGMPNAFHLVDSRKFILTPSIDSNRAISSALAFSHAKIQPPFLPWLARVYIFWPHQRRTDRIRFAQRA